jgi:hypothetical protein
MSEDSNNNKNSQELNINAFNEILMKTKFNFEGGIM